MKREDWIARETESEDTFGAISDHHPLRIAVFGGESLSGFIVAVGAAKTLDSDAQAALNKVFIHQVRLSPVRKETHDCFKDYDPKKDASVNDIALISLRSRLSVSAGHNGEKTDVIPICILSEDDGKVDEHRIVYLSAWGHQKAGAGFFLYT